MKSIFSNLPNDLIMKIIKINYDEAKRMKKNRKKMIIGDGDFLLYV
jgi:hypothetical protein